MADDGEKARDEFFSEAQEIVDGLGRDLLVLDELSRSGDSDPELVNDVFRAVHTLKGLSGLFGAALMSGLSHEVESLLDDLRLGRVELSASVLDLLFQAVELYGRILAASRGEGPEPADDVHALLAAVGALTSAQGEAQAGVLAQYDLDPSLLGVLTEYEEHRLRSNLRAGLALYRLRVSFPLATIDSALEELKARARPHGEIITFLPAGDASDPDAVELEILIASRASIDELGAALDASRGQLEEVARRDARGAAALPGGATAAGQREAAGHGSAGGAAQLALEALDSPALQSREISLKSVAQTVRVDIRRLDHLMAIVSELGLVRSALEKATARARQDRPLYAELQRLQRVLDRQLEQLQDGILEVRMVPLSQVFEKLARIVRQVSREHDRAVHLVITGAETEIDKLIVEELSDPLMHMVRNAIDHGIEDREGRMAVGKPPVGTIALNAFQKGDHVVIEVEDDGRGMSPQAIARAAVARGIVDDESAREMAPRDLLNLIFTPGFSTRAEATSLSGRGFGMDVVKTNIAKLGGLIDVASELGIGTKLTITLPVTLAVISVLSVEVAGRTFCIPLSNVSEAFSFDAAAVRTLEGREVITQRGATLPIARLANLFELRGVREGVYTVAPAMGDATRGPTRRARSPARGFVIVVHFGDKRVGFVVDDLFGQQDIVIKALGPSVRQVRGIAGATELGDQRVGLVLDAPALIEEALASLDARVPLLAMGGRS